MRLGPKAIIYLAGFFLYFICGCGSKAEDAPEHIANPPQAFKDYWYQGKAELSRFRLKQARYGEIHEGDAVLIFVTEDFLPDIQVKRDYGDAEAASVLKLNANRTFHTGLYSYSVMTSTFTAVDFEGPTTYKVSFSNQDWCGHLWGQMNLRGEQYHTSLFSYFQSEADRTATLPKTFLENEIWTWIRMAPDKLPTGEFLMIPSMLYSRLQHREAAPEKVKASLVKKKDKTFAKKKLYVYQVEYPELKRRLEIFFEKEPPFAILGWKDTHSSGFGERARELTTVAVRTHSMFTDYWNQNHAADKKLRRELGL